MSRTLIRVVEMVARGAGITFLSVWLGTQRFDLADLKYAGYAAVTSGAVAVLALLTNGHNSVTFTPPAPKPPNGSVSS